MDDELQSYELFISLTWVLDNTNKLGDKIWQIWMNGAYIDDNI